MSHLLSLSATRVEREDIASNAILPTTRRSATRHGVATRVHARPATSLQGRISDLTSLVGGMIPGLLLEASQTIAYPHPMQLAAEVASSAKTTISSISVV